MFGIYVFVLLYWWLSAAYDLTEDRDLRVFLIDCAFGFIWPIIIFVMICKRIGKLWESKQ